MPKAKPGLKEIAEAAGVAVSTVSHVLNGTASISDVVRGRVMEAARELGYLARRQARASIASLSKVLLAVPESAMPSNDVNLVSWTILSALTRDAEERGIRIIPFPIGPDTQVEAMIDAARKAGAQGIILFNDDREPLLKAIADSGIPAVLINGEDPYMHLDSVTPGNRFAAQMAVRQLLALGHRRILHLTWNGRKTVRRRLDGFRDAMTEAGRPDEDALVLMSESYTPEDGEAAMAGWLQRNPDRAGVTAVFCSADNLAFGAMKAIKARGLAIPGDLSVVGFDGVALGELHDPPLATVSVPMEQFGRAALGLIEQRCLGGERARAAHRLELGCNLIERASLARVRR
jgi:LacI family purine nucleotide synthesis repressor